MDKDEFWALIDQTVSCESLDRKHGKLRSLLSERTVAELIVWSNIVAKYCELAFKEKILAADYVINQDDNQDPTDFICWLMIQGKDAFLNILKDPDLIAETEAAPGEAKYGELCQGIPGDIYFQKEGIDPDWEIFNKELDLRSLSQREEQNILAEIEYGANMDDHWDVGSLPQVLPAVCGKFHWQEEEPIMIDMADFLKTGKFDCIKIGQAKQWILENFPNPDSDTDAGCAQSICTYGKIDFHFNQEVLFSIWCNHLEGLHAGRKIRLTHKWIFDDLTESSLRQVTEVINNKQMDYRIKHYHSMGNTTMILRKSQVRLHFEPASSDGINAVNDYRLSAFSLYGEDDNEK